MEHSKTHQPPAGENTEAEGKRRHWLTHLLTGLCMLVGGLLVGAGGALIAVVVTHQGTFYPNQSIEGISVGGLIPEEAAKKVGSHLAAVRDRKVVVAVPDSSKPRDPATNRYPDVEVSSTAHDLGVKVSASAALTQAWSLGHDGNPQHWLRQVIPTLFRGRTYSLTYSFDPAGVSTFVDTKIRAAAPAPKPAQLAVSGTSVQLTDGMTGMAVDEKELSAMLNTQLRTVQETSALYLHAPAEERYSSVSRVTLQPLADQLDAIGNLKMNFSASGVARTPTRADLLSWFTPAQDDVGVVSLNVNTSAVAKYLASSRALDQAKSLAVVQSELSNLLTTNLTSTVPSGQVTVALVAQPIKTVTAGSYTPGLFPDKYIEVNLSEQKMYRINGNSLEKVYLVSSGTWSHPTPTGTFHIAGKIPMAYSPPFGLFMPQWMNIQNSDHPTGEYGIHALPRWPNGYEEDANHIGERRSHGCVRLGDVDAVEMYAWADVGTPVVIF